MDHTQLRAICHSFARLQSLKLSARRVQLAEAKEARLAQNEETKKPFTQDEYDEAIDHLFGVGVGAEPGYIPPHLRKNKTSNPPSIVSEVHPQSDRDSSNRGSRGDEAPTDSPNQKCSLLNDQCSMGSSPANSVNPVLIPESSSHPSLQSAETECPSTQRPERAPSPGAEGWGEGQSQTPLAPQPVAAKIALTDPPNPT